MQKITILNQTNHGAQFFIRKGAQVIARLPSIAPGGTAVISTDDHFEVVATTMLDGNTYTSPPMVVQGSMSFLARILQIAAQGTYDFNVQQSPSTAANTLTFEKSCTGPVTFTISKNGMAMQNVVVSNSFEMQTLDVGDTYYAYAVVNGITTQTVEFVNPESTITASIDDAAVAPGYVVLKVS